MIKKGLFLDRDGVINIDHGYVFRIEDFKFVDGIFEFTQAAIAKGYSIFVVTNQAGIGRGYYGISDFEFLTDWMCKKFDDQGVLISEVFFSPYHPIHGKGIYKKDDMSRKPNPGMIQQAASKFNIDLSQSVLIGDKKSDIQAGHNAGIRTNIFLNANNSKFILAKPFFSVLALDEALAFL